MAEENKQSAAKAIRPTKKQKELLSFIENFIAGNGYSPSYREIMKSLDYTSVATVALHVNSLIKRGHLKKRDRSARSLEVVKNVPVGSEKSSKVENEAWLHDEVESRLKRLKTAEDDEAPKLLEEIETLTDAMDVLGMSEQAAKLRLKLADMAEQHEV